MSRAAAFLVLLCLQAAGALVFLFDLLSSALDLYDRPLSWTMREGLEIVAAVALVLGMVLGAVLVWRTFGELRQAELRLSRASAAFMDHLAARFDEWGLTAAERDVALFALKGLSIGEIAALRETTEGTIKSQTAAIYRKAGVTGRPQLLSLFIEDLTAAPLAVEADQPPEARRARA